MKRGEWLLMCVAGSLFFSTMGLGWWSILSGFSFGTVVAIRDRRRSRLF